LIASSRDGYISRFSFEVGELGNPLKVNSVPSIVQNLNPLIHGISPKTDDDIIKMIVPSKRKLKKIKPEIVTVHEMDESKAEDSSLVSKSPLKNEIVCENETTPSKRVKITSFLVPVDLAVDKNEKRFDLSNESTIEFEKMDISEKKQIDACKSKTIINCQDKQTEKKKQKRRLAPTLITQPSS